MMRNFPVIVSLLLIPATTLVYASPTIHFCRITPGNIDEQSFEIRVESSMKGNLVWFEVTVGTTGAAINADVQGLLLVRSGRTFILDNAAYLRVRSQVDGDVVHFSFALSERMICDSLFLFVSPSTHTNHRRTLYTMRLPEFAR